MDQIFNITILDQDDEDERLDKFLAENLPVDISRTYIQVLIKKGNILINNKQQKPSYKLVMHDEISINIPEPIPYEVAANKDIPLDIVYEDEYLLVINKQPGLVVHPACGHMDNGTLVNALMAHCKNLSGINGVMRPGIVHRLDKDTSGLLVAAKDDITHRGLAKQLEDRSLSRLYQTICRGIFEKEELSFTSNIGRSKFDRKKMAVVKTGGKEAITHFFVKERFNNYTLLDVKLETGRTHQIRVHLKYLGYPVLGDSTYGPSKPDNRVGRVVITINRQALHAKEIKFFHPRLKKEMSFTTGLPDDIMRVLEILRKEDR